MVRSIDGILFTIVVVWSITSSRAEDWKPYTGERKGDVGILIDLNPLEDPSAAQSLTTLNAGDHNHGEVDKWIRRWLTWFLDANTADNFDWRVAVMFHDRNTFSSVMTFEATRGRSSDDVMKELSPKLDLKISLYRERVGREKEIATAAREAFRKVEGNRLEAPDLLFWFALYHPSGGWEEGMTGKPPKLLAQFMNVENGPNTVAMSAYKQYPAGVLSWVKATEQPWECGASAGDFQRKCYRHCDVEYQTTKCFFTKSSGPCQTKTTYRRNAGSPKYCMDGAALPEDCERRICVDDCNNEPQRFIGECSVTCGDGTMVSRPKYDVGNPLLENCPDTHVSCNKGDCPIGPAPPATSGSTTTPGPEPTKAPGPTSSMTTGAQQSETTVQESTKAPKATATEAPSLETWIIIVIAIGVLFLITVAVVVIVCLVAKKRKSRRPTRPLKRSPAHRGPGPPLQHRHGRPPSPHQRGQQQFRPGTTAPSMTQPSMDTRGQSQQYRPGTVTSARPSTYTRGGGQTTTGAWVRGRSQTKGRY